MIKIFNDRLDNCSLNLIFNMEGAKTLNEVFERLESNEFDEVMLNVSEIGTFVTGEPIEKINIINVFDDYSDIYYEVETSVLNMELDYDGIEWVLSLLEETLKGNPVFPPEMYNFIYEGSELTLYGEFTDLSEKYLKKLEKEKIKDKKIALKKYILKNFSYNNSIEIQNRAIDEISIKEDVPLEMLVQHFEEEYWENATKILLIMGYPKVKEVIPNLFKWLEDLSKAGVKEIIELFKTMDRDVFVNYFENAVKKAIKKNNKKLISNLSMFMDYFDIKEEDFTAIQVYPALIEVRKIN